jgi:hypothetical protein
LVEPNPGTGRYRQARAVVNGWCLESALDLPDSGRFAKKGVRQIRQTDVFRYLDGDGG